jgi:hypothetical protein
MAVLKAALRAAFLRPAGLKFLFEISLKSYDKIFFLTPSFGCGRLTAFTRELIDGRHRFPPQALRRQE